MQPPRRLPNSYINQHNFKIAILAFLVLIVASFFTFEFRLLRAPNLEILAPEKDVAATTDIFDVSGRTDPDADLILNGRPLFSGGTGEFTERVYLVKGVNRLDFEAKNRYGKITRLTRYIVVE